MDYQKRVNPNLGGVDHSKQTKSPWEKGRYISMNSIIIREYEAKKGKKPEKRSVGTKTKAKETESQTKK